MLRVGNIRCPLCSRTSGLYCCTINYSRYFLHVLPALWNAFFAVPASCTPIAIIPAGTKPFRPKLGQRFRRVVDAQIRDVPAVAFSSAEISVYLRRFQASMPRNIRRDSSRTVNADDLIAHKLADDTTSPRLVDIAPERRFHLRSRFSDFNRLFPAGDLLAPCRADTD